MRVATVPICKSSVKGVRVEWEVRHLWKYLLTKERFHLQLTSLSSTCCSISCHSPHNPLRAAPSVVTDITLPYVLLHQLSLTSLSPTCCSISCHWPHSPLCAALYIYIYICISDDGSLLPKYRDCTTYNDFELYIYIYIYVSITCVFHLQFSLLV